MGDNLINADDIVIPPPDIHFVEQILQIHRRIERSKMDIRDLLAKTASDSNEEVIIWRSTYQISQPDIETTYSSFGESHMLNRVIKYFNPPVPHFLEISGRSPNKAAILLEFGDYCVEHEYLSKFFKLKTWKTHSTMNFDELDDDEIIQSIIEYAFNPDNHMFGSIESYPHEESSNIPPPKEGVHRINLAPPMVKSAGKR